MSGIFKKFKSGDKKITSHFAHKLYTVNVSNHTGSYVEAGYAQKRIVDNVEVDVDLAVFSYDTLYDGSKFEPDIYDVGGNISKYSPHIRTTNGLFKRSIHDSLQAMYYTDTMNPANTQHNIGFEKEFRSLHKTAQVLSVPQVMMGSGIVKESVIITSGSIVLKDDGFGNLIDTTLITSSIIPETRSLDLDFNSLYNKEDVKILSAYSMNSLADGDDKLPLDNKVRFFDNSAYANKVVARNFIPIDGGFGTALEFNGVSSADANVRGEITSQSLIRVKAGPQFDFRDEGAGEERWQIMLKVSASIDQPSKDIPYASPYTEIISKGNKNFPVRLQYINTNDNTNKGKYRIQVKDDRGNLYTGMHPAVPHKDSNGFTSISITRFNNSIIFTIRSGATSVNSFPINLDANANQKKVGNTNNKNPWIVGAKLKWRGKYKKKKRKGDYSKTPKPRKEYYRNFKGAIGEFTIYRGANYIAGTPLTNIMCDINTTGENDKVGNVFYNHGIITLTGKSARYKQGPRSSTFADCDLIFENTHQIVEQEYTCQVKEQEFGFTLNPSIIKPNKDNELKDFVTGSAWTPYVTTIGLYDKNARLLAIGKLAQPIKKSTEYDTTFVVRFDS